MQATLYTLWMSSLTRTPCVPWCAAGVRRGMCPFCLQHTKQTAPGLLAAADWHTSCSITLVKGCNYLCEGCPSASSSHVCWLNRCCILAPRCKYTAPAPVQPGSSPSSHSLLCIPTQYQAVVCYHCHNLHVISNDSRMGLNLVVQITVLHVHAHAHAPCRQITLQHTPCRQITLMHSPANPVTCHSDPQCVQSWCQPTCL